MVGSTCCQLVTMRVTSLVTTTRRSLTGPGAGSVRHAEQRRVLGAPQPTQKERRSVVPTGLLTLKIMRGGDDAHDVAIVPTAWPDVPQVLPLATTMLPDACPW
jgi:hypothetical protein